MQPNLSRREMLGLTTAAALTAAGIDWAYVRNARGGISVVAAASPDWTPVVFTGDQAASIAAVCEAIIPRTDTPGALDAKAHQFIDLQLSEEGDTQQQLFLEGLSWLEDRCHDQFGKSVSEIGEDDLHALLEPISDLHESHPDDLKTGVSFFGNVKRRVIFAFYTSEEGWVQDLGLPGHPSLTAEMEGCHGED